MATVDKRPVMVLTDIDDPTADLVVEELNQRSVPIVRFDTADFPSALVVSADITRSRGWEGTLRTPTRSVDLTAVRSLYYRRPGSFDFSHLDEQDARFASAQARFGLGGLLASLPDCQYVNHPNSIADAEYKPVQLGVARECGFRVLPTLFTNDLAEARAFARAYRRIIYKPLYVGSYELDGRAASIWVREVDAKDLDESIAGTMHLFQARCNKIADLRVTVIGDQVFCVRIETEDPNLLDWRFDYDQLSYSVVDAPAGLVDSMQAYLKRFSLVFGCFDFAITPLEQAVFLECNPNGQWAWLEDETGLPMVAAMADLLERKARR